MLRPSKSFLLQKISDPLTGDSNNSISKNHDDDHKKKKGKLHDKSHLMWLLKMSEHEKLPLVIGVCGMTTSSFMALWFPKIMGKAIDVAAGNRPPAGLSKKGFIAIVLASFVTGAIGSVARVYSLGMVSERIAARLRKKLYSVLLAQPYNYYHTRKVGSLVHKFSDDCQVIANSVVDVMSTGFRSLNSAIGATAMLFTISPKLTLVSLSIVPLVGAGAMLSSKLSSSLAKIHQDSIAHMTGCVDEKLHNIFTIKLFAAEDYEREQFRKENDKILYHAFYAKRARALFMGGLSLSVNCSLFSVLYYGGTLVGSNELTIGSLTSFALYSGFMGLGFSQLSSTVGEVRRVRESSEVLLDLLDTLPDHVEHEGTIIPEKITGLIEFENVGFTYPSRPDQKVLHNLTIKFKRGELVAIVGRSGAGKTTCASLLTKILSPSMGKITLDGININTINTPWLRRQIGVVNQEPALFATTVLENIMYGSTNRNEAQAIEAAKIAHAHEFILELTEGYQTHVGEKGLELSGGQKQRLAIARALYKDPTILLLDEATSSLDGRSEDMIRKAMQSAAKDRTVIIIAHRLETIKSAQRIVLLENGTVAETGTFADLNKNGTKFHSLVNNTNEYDRA